MARFEAGGGPPENVPQTPNTPAEPGDVDAAIKTTNARLEHATKERDAALRSTEEHLVKAIPGLEPGARPKAVTELNRVAAARGATYRYELRGDAAVKVETVAGTNGPEAARDQALAKEVTASLGGAPTRDQVDRAQTKLLLAGMTLRIGTDGNPQRGPDGGVIIDVPENPSTRGMLVLAGLFRTLADLWRGNNRAPGGAGAPLTTLPGSSTETPVLSSSPPPGVTPTPTPTPTPDPTPTPTPTKNPTPTPTENADKNAADPFLAYNENPLRIVNVRLTRGQTHDNVPYVDISLDAVSQNWSEREAVDQRMLQILRSAEISSYLHAGNGIILIQNITPDDLRRLAELIESAVRQEANDEDDEDGESDESDEDEADDDDGEEGEDPAESAEVKVAMDAAKSRYSAALRRVPGVNHADIEGALQVRSSKDSDGALRLSVELQPSACGISEDMAARLSDGFQGSMGGDAQLFSDADSIADLAQYTNRFVSLVDRYWPPADSESTPELRRAANQALSSLTSILRTVAVDDRKLDVESAITVTPRDGKQVVGLHIGALSSVVPPQVISAVTSSCFSDVRIGRFIATAPLTTPEPGRESQSELSRFVESVRAAVNGAKNHPDNAKWTADARAALTEEDNAARDMTRDAVAQLAGIRGVTSADGAIAVFRQPVASRPGGHFLVQFLPGTATGLSDADTTAIGTLFAQREMGVTEGGEPMVSAYESRFTSADDTRAFMKTFAQKAATLRS